MFTLILIICYKAHANLNEYNLGDQIKIHDSVSTLVNVRQLQQQVYTSPKSKSWIYLNIYIYSYQADSGSKDHQYLLGLLRLYGYQVDKDPADAFKYFLKAAYQNHGYAQFAIGVQYFLGEGSLYYTCCVLNSLQCRCC